MLLVAAQNAEGKPLGNPEAPKKDHRVLVSSPFPPARQNACGARGTDALDLPEALGLVVEYFEQALPPLGICFYEIWIASGSGYVPLISNGF